jgi:hypothetical protein
MGEVDKALVGFLLGLGGLISALVIYLLLMPEKAERVLKSVTRLAAMCAEAVDRTKVAHTVQRAVNARRVELQKDGPDLLEKKLKVRWAKADEAEAQLSNGEVLVVMRRSRHIQENIAHAVMAYLPKALLPLARPYFDKERMRAADLVIAKSLFAHEDGPAGALGVFVEKHLEPARAEGVVLKKKIVELDDLDLDGWLTRVLLTEYRHLGNQLHPGEPDEVCVQDGERLARWLHSLSARAPGDDTLTLTYSGDYFRVAIIFVARKELLEHRGLAPYRRRAKRYLYEDKLDAVYLMGRDETIASVQALADELERDGRVAAVTRYDYALRSDFKRKRKLDRDRAAVICLRRRQAADEPPPELADDDGDEFPVESHDPSRELVGQQARAAVA